jgi:hypothetical protein
MSSIDSRRGRVAAAASVVAGPRGGTYPTTEGKRMHLVRRAVMRKRGLTIVLAGLLATTGVAQAASRTIKIQGNRRYAGMTNQNVDFRRGYFQSGRVSLHLNARKQIDGFGLTWRCKGQRFIRRTRVTTLEGIDAPIPIKNRAFSFKLVVPWADYEEKFDRTGTATVSVRGSFFKHPPKPPKGRDLPYPLSTFSIGSGTLTVVEGACRLPLKWELDRGNTLRMGTSEFATY